MAVQIFSITATQYSVDIVSFQNKNLNTLLYEREVGGGETKTEGLVAESTKEKMRSGFEVADLLRNFLPICLPELITVKCKQAWIPLYKCLILSDFVKLSAGKKVMTEERNQQKTKTKS